MLAMFVSIFEWENTAAAHRVPSAASPSDAPSRMDFKGLPESCQRVDVPALWRSMSRPQPGDMRLV